MKALQMTILYGILINLAYWTFRPYYNPLAFSLTMQVTQHVLAIIGALGLCQFVYIFCLAPWYRPPQAQTASPFVSVIIPAWNEEVGIVNTLKTLLRSTYKSFEIIVINDGSTDGTDEKLCNFLMKYKQMGNTILIRYHAQANGGKGSALNAGIRLAVGQIIVTLDADCVAHPTMIETFVRAFAADPALSAAAGNIRIGNTRTLLGCAQALEYIFGFVRKQAEALQGVVFVIGGAAAAFRREVFETVGGYHVGLLTEDLELSLRIHEAGLKIGYIVGAVVYTEGPVTLAGLLKQRIRWKRGRFQVIFPFFFSRKEAANKRFFWLTLPAILLADLQYLLLGIFTLALDAICLITFDPRYVALAIAATAAAYCVQFLYQEELRRPEWFLLAPLAWFLLHIILVVENYALFSSLWTIITHKHVAWQKWQRAGVVGRSSK